MFGGIPATGAVARTATNVKNGGRTPIAGITHAVVLLVITLLLAPYAKLIPMASLAGILVVVAYHMSEWRQFKSLLRGGSTDVLILLATFFLTIIFDLVVAIEVGIVLSSFVVMKRMSDSMSIEDAGDVLADINGNGERLFEEELPALPKGVAIYEIHGALFFGVAQLFQDTINNLQKKPKVLILRMRHVPFIDATGVYRLKEVIKQFSNQKVSIILSGVTTKVLEDLEKADIYSVLEKENLLRNISGSLTRANELLDGE
jgi:SulP family sulfate permease